MNTNNEEGALEKNRRVEIYVKTKQLFELGERPTEDQIDNRTSLRSNQHSETISGVLENNWKSHKDFELLVFKNHTMQWTLPQRLHNTADPGYEAKLISVHHVPTGGSPNFFDKEDLNAASDGKVKATIKDNSQVNQSYVYIIKFTISHNGVTRKYTIDPKLKINS
ncbi:hypothetical protein K8089_13690 [Aequorivita sp. F47161]|uniref:OmpA-like domain-containing protein n=1 Tax=Aequorivita vitellina TaxID=2874475 RepID=A0A9X1U4A3_9FLAO|nr:hypothetical protein [Aequorivita vitellina]MCG2420077.1 hypothetical protein [Aequorivita vitellina]